MRKSNILLWATAIAALGARVATGQPADRCEILRGYLAARSAAGPQAPAQATDFAHLWLPRLLDIAGVESCGQGLSSARWHAMSLANQIEDWGLARLLATQGREIASSDSERALWQMNVANATFRAIDRGSPVTIRLAIDELDRALTLAPRMADTSPPGRYPAWLLPALSSLHSKAECQRMLGDHIAAASTMQRAATTFVAAGAASEPQFGGFLPEEAYYRASLDYVNAERPSEAAGCLASIALLPSPARPAGQHAYNAVTGMDPSKARALTWELTRQLPADGWMVLCIHHVANTSVGSGENADREAISLVDQALGMGEARIAEAGTNLERLQGQAGMPASEPDQAAGFHALLLRDRARLELDAGDLNAARSTIAELTRRGWLSDWCTKALLQIASRKP